ncbi:MAG TPA: hypothetical protein VJY15_16530 [Candidatus Acidoferrum sp.]|nr:hypothetical protein [Candidatus Acidoferrum sp.]
MEGWTNPQRAQHSLDSGKAEAKADAAKKNEVVTRRPLGSL